MLDTGGIAALVALNVPLVNNIDSWASFYQHGLSRFMVWVSNHIHSFQMIVITYVHISG